MNDSARFGPKTEARSAPAPFRQIAPRMYEVKRGGGRIAVFGLPFFLAGIAMELTAPGIFLKGGQSSGDGLTLGMGLMGLVFLAVGGAMVLGRRWLVLDLDRGSILRQMGLLIAMRTEERRLGEFMGVVISHDPGDSETGESFPVKLRASMGKDIAIGAPGQYGESRAMAEFLAQLLHLPLSDSTSGFETTVSPERLGESLRDRLKAEAMPGPPARPAAMRCKVEEKADTVKIAIPSAGPGAAGYLGFLLPLAMYLVAILFATRTASEPTGRLTFLVVITIIFGAPTIYGGIRFMMARKRKATTVTASAAEITIEEPKGRGSRTTVIPATDLLDIDSSTFDSTIAPSGRQAGAIDGQRAGGERVLAALKKLVPNPGIIVKSRAGLVRVGEGLSTDELHYVVWLLRKAVSA
ncbi:MAG: hypothetical protein P4K78_03500 [Terracidiphilus sp.]|nr:hypothetical protein [Terracidiphilus sp.]